MLDKFIKLSPEMFIKGYRIPSYGIELTKEQVELIKYKELKLYEVDGKTLFPIEGTDKYMVYIYWK